MNYEYWLDLIEYCNNLIKNLEEFTYEYAIMLIKKGVKIQIGDVDLNEIYNKIIQKEV